ncbi:Hypothetical protein mma_2209 [Janthinobacterium sp. Marseille]|nr:hypothetical protein [Janthinobacterium sp. Marseille]ABR91758.1 Hypothetical protein mma_2209 [Janthinobacterium sp. Marseille]
MARARNIKPGFFLNEELVELPFVTRLLFIGLWTLADREGRLEDKPKRIKMNLFPADDVNVDECLEQLQKGGFLLRYEHEGERFIQVLAFAKHQNPHRDEKSSSIPAPCEHGANTVQEPSKNDVNRADSLIPDSLISDSGLLGECAEPQSVSTQAFMMPLIGDKMFPIPEAQIVQWAIAYPAVDVSRQLFAMRQWCVANPTQKKTERGILRFCNSWLMKKQDKPRANARGSPNGYESVKDRERRETIAGLTGGGNERSEATIIDIN